MHSNSALRGLPVKSKAPAVTSASTTFLLILRVSMRPQKSNNPANGLARAARIASMAFSPTPLMAPRPKRMRDSPGFFGSGPTPKARSDSLTSGGSTVMPSARASAMWATTLSVLSFSEVSSAAMNSTGWCAFSQAV